MELSETKRNRIFWLLQFLGWGSLNLLSAMVLKNVSFQFLLFNVLVGTFTGVLATSLLRYYLRKEIVFDGFGLREITKILVGTALSAILYAGLNYGAGYFYGRYFSVENDFELRLLESYHSFWLVALSSFLTVFGWVVLYLVIKLLLKLNKDRIERLELNSTLKQAQLNTLKGQINPHFMFNSLNNIRGLMLEDVEKSREMLTKLSEMLRYSLTKNDTNAIALEEELEMVANYIDLSRIQFEDRLEYVEDVDPESLHVPIPPMVVQLLVENAAKHGISNLKRGGTITLKTELGQERLLIRVSNTGSLRISPDSTQLGLQNIRQRLRLLYGRKAHFTIEEKNGEVVATVEIPIK